MLAHSRKVSALVLMTSVLLWPSFGFAERHAGGDPSISLGAPISAEVESAKFRAEVPAFAKGADEWPGDTTAQDLRGVRRLVSSEIQPPGVSISIKEAAKYLEENHPAMFQQLVSDVLDIRGASEESFGDMGKDFAEAKREAARTALARMATFYKTKAAFEALQLHIFAEKRGLANVKIGPPTKRSLVGKTVDGVKRVLHREDTPPSDAVIERHTVITGGVFNLKVPTSPKGVSLTRGGPTTVWRNGERYDLNAAGRQMYAELSTTDAGANNPKALTDLALQAHFKAEADAENRAVSRPRLFSRTARPLPDPDSARR